MSQATTDPSDDDELPRDPDEAEADPDADKDAVEREQGRLREFVKGLSGDDIKSGNWFTKLVAHSLNAYTTQVNWEYFQRKYDGVPADAIVDQRIKMAARYAHSKAGSPRRRTPPQ